MSNVWRFEYAPFLTFEFICWQDVNDDSMDDFGIDLYAIPEPPLTKIDDEDSRFTAVVNKTATDWQR